MATMTAPRMNAQPHQLVYRNGWCDSVSWKKFCSRNDAATSSAGTKMIPTASRTQPATKPTSRPRPARTMAYVPTALGDYLAAQVRPLLVAQLETATTDDPPEEILAAGVDVAFIGTTDLTVDLELDAERVAARVEELLAAAERAGVYLGGFGLSHERLRYEVRSADVALLRKAV